MTWYYIPDGNTIDIFDHTGELVAENREFSGRWSSVPDVVFDVMDEEAVDAFKAGDIQRMLQCLRHGAFELVEEGPPPSNAS